VALQPIKLPPGLFRNGTEYQAAGRWYDGNLIRWHNGRLKPIGGWVPVLSGGATLTGIARGIAAWTGKQGFRYVAVGTNQKLYTSSGGSYSDTSPVDLVAGRQDSIDGPGFGAGAYGKEGYGTQRTLGVVELQAATWSLDTFGEDLLAVLNSDGRLLHWSPTIGGLAATLTGAPTGNVGVLVTDELYVLALGAGGDRRKIQWPDEGSLTSWAVTLTGTAGSRQLQTNGQILAGRMVGSVPVIWTTTDVHALTFVGSPDIYRNDRIAESCGLIGPNAVCALHGVAEWMGFGAFFRYDGAVKPLPCDVQDYVFGDFNQLQRSKVYAAHNSEFSEITWFYCSANSLENDRYVTHNYADDIWYFGQLARTAWVDRGVFDAPFAVDPAGVVWQHETGWLAGGASRNGQVFLQSGPAEIGNGDRVVYGHTIVPDVGVTPGAVSATIKTRAAPQAPESVLGPISLVPNAEGRVDARFCGRQVSVLLSQVQDVEWTLGTFRVDTIQGGKR
jgi:hypothetical protein